VDATLAQLRANTQRLRPLAERLFDELRALSLDIRNAHGSDIRNEHMAIDDFLLANEVLAQALLDPVRARAA